MLRAAPDQRRQGLGEKRKPPCSPRSRRATPAFEWCGKQSPPPHGKLHEDSQSCVDVIGDASSCRQRHEESVHCMERGGEKSDTLAERRPTCRNVRITAADKRMTLGNRNPELIDAERCHAAGHQPERAWGLVQPHMIHRASFQVKSKSRPFVVFSRRGS